MKKRPPLWLERWRKVRVPSGWREVIKPGISSIGLPIIWPINVLLKS
ncbi:hypothetical protein DUE52_00835 [Larkinella punicea]|uniref:PSP proline-rich domain-containing protein n=1 Tax=Larkinella punicea TaxID=2315727 RepID=A0A368JV20_9BACT|nr:hypothetical protein DUE52_00835 [Larkinella punicea]